MSESFKVGEAPWEQPQRTANSAKPSSLSRPVPKAQIAQPTPQDAPEAIPVGSAPWEQDEGAAPQPSGEIPPEQFAQEPGFMQANMEQFQNLGDRILYGLSANNTEALGKLQQKYGPENAVMKNDEIWFRKDPKKKLKRLDPDQFELFTDLIPDGARNIIMEATMLPAEIGMGMMGASVGPGGAAVGASAGRVASVPMATTVAEGVARQAGIPQDPNRDPSREAQIGMAIETAIPGIGGPLVRAVGKRIPGTMAYKAAKEAGKKEIVALSAQSREVAESAARLESQGEQNKLMLHHLQPNSPQVKALADTAASTSKLANAELEVAQGLEAGIQNTLNYMGKMKNPKGPIPGGKIGANIKSVIDDLDQREAEEIGKWRNKALAESKNAKQQLPTETSQRVTQLMKELGFQPKRVTKKIITRPGSIDGAAARGISPAPQTIERVSWTPPLDIKAIEGRMGLTEGQPRALINALTEYEKFLSRGNEARLTDVEHLIKRMGPLSQKLRGTEGGAHLGKIVGELRQHRRQIIGNHLDKGGFEDVAYNTVMDDFSLIRQNVDELAKVMDGDMSNKAVIKYFFKEAKGPERIRALKKILKSDSHQFQAAREEFVMDMMVEYGNKADKLTRYNATAFLNDINRKYGKEFMQEVFDDPKVVQKLKDQLTLAQRFEATTKGIKSNQMTKEQAKAGADVLAGAAFGVRFKYIGGLMRLLRLDDGKENAAMELMNRDGFHKYIKDYKGQGDKSVIARNVEEMLMRYNSARAAHKKTAEVLDIGKDITKRGIRAEVREESSRD